MLKFFKKLFFFSSPIIFLLLLYIMLDPFKVVRNYDQYLSDYVMLHRGYVSTTMYLKNRTNHNFDSFIFGSSHSCAHLASEWEKYLPEESNAFSYGSWSERIVGIYNKIALVDTLNDPINNAFIIVDGSTFLNRENPLAGEHYLISGQSKMGFHYYYFKQFLDPKMFITSLDYFIFKRRRAYMEGFQGMKKTDLDTANNDWLRDKVPADSAKYYSDCSDKFYKRDTIQKYYPKKIDEKEIQYLLKIKRIFNKHQTKYYFVISPLYDQMKIHPEDLKILEEIFGKQNIYDYSGINSLTNNNHHYLEDVFHYRYEVGAYIYNQIYKPKKENTSL